MHEQQRPLITNHGDELPKLESIAGLEVVTEEFCEQLDREGRV